MAKRIGALMLAMTFFFAFSIPAYAQFRETGGWTVTDTRYSLFTEEAVLEFKKDLSYEENNHIDYSDIYTGSNLYVPLYVDHNDWDSQRQATSKDVKEDNVEVSYVDIVGGRYIDSVTIVDGKKEKVGLDSGMYVKIAFAESYAGTSRYHIQIRIVLSVNKVSYQESKVTLECDITNRLEFINEHSVFGAQIPASFKVGDTYDGGATFDMGDGVRYTATVKRGAKYSIDFTRDVDYDIDLMYPSAYLEFYNFRGNNDTFASVGRLQIPINTSKFKDSDGNSRVYAYEVVSGSGTTLRALGSDSANYDSRNKVLTINTQSLGYYVLSNEKLFQSVESVDDTFQSGYADDDAAAAQEIETAEQATQQQNNAPNLDVATTPVTVDVDEEQDPIETIDPEPVPTGDIVIAARNVSGDNPPTSGISSPLPVAALGGLVCVSLLALGFRKRS